MIVVGWYSKDYESYASVLKRDLDDRNLTHSFYTHDRHVGSRIDVNRLRAYYMWSALRTLDDTILFMDVDCRLFGTTEQLEEACRITTDVGVVMTNEGVLLPGVVVLRPTYMSKEFAFNWYSMFHRDMGDHSMLKSVVETQRLTATVLNDAVLCADKVTDDTLILHQHNRHRVTSMWRKIYQKYFCRGAANDQ